MDIDQFERLVSEGQYEKAKTLAEAEILALARNPSHTDLAKTRALNEFINRARMRLDCNESATKVIRTCRAGS